jgi:hypothetical protein
VVSDEWLVSEQLQELPMSYPDQNGTWNQSGAGEAEKTLRLIARLPAPQGLEDRVQAGLHSAPRGGRVFAWPVSQAGGWQAGEWMRAAAAAVIVFVVAGGGWGIYSRVEPGQPGRGMAGPGVTGPRLAGPRLAAPGRFSEGGAVRRPQTLVGPVVSPAATHLAAATAPKPKAPAKAAITPTPKSAAARKTSTPPVAPRVQ